MCGIQFVIYLVPYLIIGYDIVYKAVRNISHGQVFDENFLMMVATVGAFGVQEFSEAVAVMLFYQVGELFQSYAVGKSRQSISAMMDICPEYANIEQNGVLTQVDPDDVEVGDIIVIKPGERIPLDGVVIEGESLVDTAALTGESVPRSAKAGDEIISGCVNGSGTLKVKVTKEFDDSTVAKILELVENASSKKAKVENFITKFANIILRLSRSELWFWHWFLHWFLGADLQNGSREPAFSWLSPAHVHWLSRFRWDSSAESEQHPKLVCW